MSVLRLYEDSNLTQIVSKRDDFDNPDDESSLDGTNGEVKVKELWVAIEQTTLDGGIDDQQTTITLAAPRFANESYSVIRIDDEFIKITAGFDTITLTVIRGYKGSTPASHSGAAAVRLAYNCTNISIEEIDTETESGDESAWVGFRDYGSGSYESPHNLGDLDYNEKKRIQRQLTVPATTAAQDKRDLVHRLDFDVEEAS